MKKLLLIAFALCTAFAGYAQQNSKLTVATNALLQEYRALKADKSARTVKAIGNQLREVADLYSVAAPQQTNGEQFLHVWVKLSDNNFSALSAIDGVTVTAEFDRLATAVVTFNALDKIAALTNVEQVSASAAAEAETYDARRNSRAIDLQTFSAAAQAAGIDKAYDGTGVIFGIVDQGIMYNHTAFQDADGNSRVKAVFQYNSSTKVIDTYTDASAIAALTTNSTSTTHGTHVASVAAGRSWTFDKYFYDVQTSKVVTSGTRTYGGMAPNADIVMCDLGADGSAQSNIAAAVKKIFDYASDQGKACVINISLGSLSGGRDGTGEFATAISAFRDQPGRIICCSAGNYGQYYIYNNTKGSKASAAAIVFKYVGSYGVGYTYNSATTNNVVLNGSATTYARTPNEPLACRVFAVNTATNTLLWISDEITTSKTFSVNSSDKSSSSYTYDATLANYFDREVSTGGRFAVSFSQDAYSNKYYITTTATRILSKVTSTSGGTTTGNATFGILVYPTSASANITFDTFGATATATMTNTLGGSITIEGNTYTYNASSPDCSVGNMCTSPDVIATASYCNMLEWTSNAQASTSTEFTTLEGSYPDPAPTASYAVENSPAPRVLPDITSPGRNLFGAYNAYGPEPAEDRKCRDWSSFADNAKYYSAGGASQASPVTAGICALLLQINPYLTVAQIRELLQQTSITDSHTTTAQSGAAGRIDAVAAAAELIKEMQGITVSTEDLYLNTKTTDAVTETFEVSSRGLTDDITVSLIDPDGVFAVDKTSISYTDTENGYVQVTVTFNPGATTGAHKALVRLSSPGVNPTDVALTGDYSSGASYWDPCAKYFNIPSYESITEETFPNARAFSILSGLTNVYKATPIEGTDSTWVTFPAAALFYAKMKDNCQWVAYANYGSVYNATWTAYSPCLGSTAYFSTKPYQVGSTTEGTGRTMDFCVTGITEVKMREHGTKAGSVAPKIEAFECTISGDTPTPAATASASKTGTAHTGSGYKNVTLSELDASKVYLIRMTFPFKLCEIAFKIANASGSSEIPKASVATSVETSLISITVDQNAAANTSFYVTGTDLTDDITLTLQDDDGVFELDRYTVTVAEAQKTASAVKAPFVSTKATGDGQEVNLNIDTSNAGTYTGRIILTSQGAMPAAIDITATVDPVTGIVDVIATPADNNGAWYTLQGQRLNAKPVQKGVYIQNGRKVLIP